MRYENADGGRERSRPAYTSRMPGCLPGFVLRVPVVGFSRQGLCGSRFGCGGVGVASVFEPAVGGGDAGHSGQKTRANHVAGQIRQHAGRNAARSCTRAEAADGSNAESAGSPGSQGAAGSKGANSFRACDRRATGGSGAPPERGGWRGCPGDTRYGTGREK